MTQEDAGSPVPPAGSGQAATVEPGAVGAAATAAGATIRAGAADPAADAPPEPASAATPLPAVRRAAPEAGAPAATDRRDAARPLSRPVAFHLVLLLGYLAAGVAVSWPRPTFLAGRLPATFDQASYVWGFWWVAHQVTHLGNLWFTKDMAAPAGVQLGLDTLMPLPGVVMTPITVAFGPSVAYNLLTIVTPGLACYAAWRAARLWLQSQLAAVAAGGLYGLATMLIWQDWYHLNIAAGAVFPPLALEAAVRLSRRPGWRSAVVLGLVVGASALVNQQSGGMTAIVAVAALLPWLSRRNGAAAWRQAGLALVVALIVAGPQIVAMVQQAESGGAVVGAHLLAAAEARYGTPLSSLFAPSPRVADYGLTSPFYFGYPLEGVPTFGLMVTVLGVAGLVVGWRRGSARLLALMWAGCAALALGPVLQIRRQVYVPIAVTWHGARMSALLPFTWFVRIPGMDAMRESDRFALLGLLPAALLAGCAVEWLSHRWRPVLVTAILLAALETGYSGAAGPGTMPTAMPALDGRIAADHSGTIVVDVPFGLRGGLQQWGRAISWRALVLATADGHPRAVSYTSIVPRPAVHQINRRGFYRYLVAAEKEQPVSAAHMQVAHRDALRMHIEWAIVWKPAGNALAYLRGTGFTYRYRVGSIAVYRLASAPVASRH